ncbi:MAG TPA: alpha-L-rhamnosidase C-terminal domain-containing protein [Acidobacteriaceae bacterium]
MTTLHEQFIWTKDDAAALRPAYQATVRGQDDKIAPHYFRAHFSVSALSPEATLYIAGPRSATVMLNGTKVLEFKDQDAGKGFRVSTADVKSALNVGENVLAIEEVRGHSSLHTGASPVINQVTYGEVLAVKIVPRAIAVNAPPLLISDGSWRSTLNAAPNWSSASYDDSGWPAVQTLGVLGGRSDFLQWNADAGLYAWPGYSGIGPAMRTFRVPPIGVRDASGEGTGRSSVMTSAGAEIRVARSQSSAPFAVTLDFGKEISGRVHLVSSSDHAVTVGTSYGESAAEALGHPYLGVRQVTVAPHGEAYGPKSAFRYVRLTFPADADSTWSRVDAQGIAYPVEYKGSFESSDPTLNRIWETGAYTAHLCMQEDGIWDGVKRDRGRWMGDLDVSGRVINSVFAERPLMEGTLTAVIGDSPVQRDVNTIAGYSAFWITGQADFYRHSGDLEYLKSMHSRMLELLRVMDGELDESGLFTNPGKHKIFVDWSDGFSADTEEARAATHFEFYLAYQEAVYLLREMGDTANAEAYTAKAEQLRTAAQEHLLDTAANTFGARWQTNAMAVMSGAANRDEQRAIWERVLSRVGAPASMTSIADGPRNVITPYYGYYLLDAMAQLDHRPEALRWMRQYWGGMIADGATSFWEAYDPRWGGGADVHALLEADGKKGYYVSLAHAWSSGPTVWLMEQVLGIRPTAAGFREVSIRPDAAGLQWARGAEPTPRGAIRVGIEVSGIHITLPADTVATISLPFAPEQGKVLENGRPVDAAAAEGGARSIVMLRAAGDYVFSAGGARR